MMQKTVCVAKNQTKIGREIYTRNESPISNDSVKCQKRKDFSVEVHSEPGRAQWNVGKPGPKKASLPLRWGKSEGWWRTSHNRDTF